LPDFVDSDLPRARMGIERRRKGPPLGPGALSQGSAAPSQLLALDRGRTACRRPAQQMADDARSGERPRAKWRRRRSPTIHFSITTTAKWRPSIFRRPALTPRSSTKPAWRRRISRIFRISTKRRWECRRTRFPRSRSSSARWFPTWARIFTDRRRMADQRCAKNINELIPFIYDTQRTETIIGRDDKTLLQDDQRSERPEFRRDRRKIRRDGRGRPGQRDEAHARGRADDGFRERGPQSAALVMDLIAEAQDWPKPANLPSASKCSCRRA
jgi:hypothetical protein